MMNVTRKTLRDAIESWLTPNGAIPFRIHFLRRTACRRCVRIDARASTGDVAICFFQHDDGAWHVFPPQPRHATMRIA
ncbi:hypothetical protein BYI23_D005950 (plasmid) [Burkholderia sp. YI23]|nr:hypothetical protein BYI23_D005950 [Burkholderia sp. YI23]